MPVVVCVDLYCGLGGWAEGFLAEGYHVRGYDIEAHDYGTGGYPGELILADVLKLHGRDCADATVIVGSSPCTEYSYMAMPWARAKQIAAALRGQGEFPEVYTGSRTIEQLNALYEAQFRIQREACEAAGRYIPLIVENVRGAQPWVGRAKANFGSYYLWGDVGMVGKRVVAGMPRFGVSVSPMSSSRKNGGGSWFAIAHNMDSGHSKNPVNFPDEHMAQKRNPDGTEHGPGSWFKIADSKERGGKTPTGNCSPILWKDREVARYAHPTPEEMEKQGFNVTAAQRYREERKDKFATDPEKGGSWFGEYQPGKGSARNMSSKSDSRKAASAQIAKIPFPLASYIARSFRP